MKNGVAEIKDIKEITDALSKVNKKYVIAVANALLFSQSSSEQSHKFLGQTAQPYKNP